MTISNPFAKAVLSLCSGAGASAMSMLQAAHSFLPNDLAGWMAVFASTVASIYSCCVLGEWIWKRVVKPRLRRGNKG